MSGGGNAPGAIVRTVVAAIDQHADRESAGNIAATISSAGTITGSGSVGAESNFSLQQQSPFDGSETWQDEQCPPEFFANANFDLQQAFGAAFDDFDWQQLLPEQQNASDLSPLERQHLAHRLMPLAAHKHSQCGSPAPSVTGSSSQVSVLHSQDEFVCIIFSKRRTTRTLRCRRPPKVTIDPDQISIEPVTNDTSDCFENRNRI